MAWFRCPCGHVARVTPARRLRDYLSLPPARRARVAGGSEPVRMEEVPATAHVSTPEPALAGAR